MSAAETLNFTKTAKELFITQPAVTQHIHAIEKELGVKLFLKDGKKVLLTPAGTVLMTGLKNILMTYDALCLQVKQTHMLSSELRIGYHEPIDWATMSSLVAAFERENPNVQINISIDHWGTLVHDLNHRLLDIVFTTKPEMKAYPELQFLDLFTEGASVCMSKTNPLSKQNGITPELLAGENLIMTTSPYPSESMDTIISRLTSCGIDMKHARYVNQFETAMTMAAAGMGVTFLPRSFHVYEHPSLVFVDLCRKWDFVQ